MLTSPSALMLPTSPQLASYMAGAFLTWDHVFRAQLAIDHIECLCRARAVLKLVSLSTCTCSHPGATAPLHAFKCSMVSDN